MALRLLRSFQVSPFPIRVCNCTRGVLEKPACAKDAARWARRVPSILPEALALGPFGYHTQMSWVRAVALGLAVVSCGTSLYGAPGGPQGSAPQLTRANAAPAGWQAIREGRNQDAAEAFAIALDAEPRDPSLHFGAGLTAYLLGRPTVAQQSLERALLLYPGFAAASLLLGDILYRGSDIESALRVYEAAFKLAPDDKTLIARLEAMRREATLHNDFFRSQGSHFTVLFEGPADEELARLAIEMLEAAYWRIGTELSTYQERVITVVLYTQEQFRDITRSPDWAAAAYDGRIRVPVRGVRSDTRELERVLGHEFTHALIQSIAPRGVPTWLNEGLAVLFEPTGTAWADAQLAGAAKRFPLTRLAGSFSGLSGPEARLAYAQSAATVRALVEQGGAPAVVAVLQDIAGGETFAAAFEKRMFLPYETFLTNLAGPSN